MKKIVYCILAVIGVALLFAGCSEATPDEMKNPTIDPPVNEGKLEDWEDRYIGTDVILPSQTIMVAGHEAIDLGLPSGTLWATCNVGAEGPEYIGTRMAGDSISFDWGGAWRLPTREEAEELFKYCVFYYENGYYYTTDWYIPICRVVGPNGNSILLPPTVVTLFYGGADITGNYWLDSMDTTDVPVRETLIYGIYTYGITKCYVDAAVRLVCKK